MSDYRFPGNDPNRQREVQSPEQVRQMMVGAGSEYNDEQGAQDLKAMFGAKRPAGWLGGQVMALAPVSSPEERQRVQAQLLVRCLPCGREFDCCCQGCETCPQTKMGPGMISAKWARKMNLWSGIDPREGVN